MSVIDEHGSARAALAEIVRDHGPATLDDPARLGAVLSDLLPNNPRESTLLVAAAGAHVAGQLAARTAAGMSPDVAARDVAALLSDTASLDLTRATWVVTEYANALGYLPAPTASPPAAPAPAWPAPPPYVSPVQPVHPDAGYPPPRAYPAAVPAAVRPAGRSGLIAAIAGALAIAAVIAGVYTYVERRSSTGSGTGTAITGLVDFHGRTPDVLEALHQDGPITYTMTPPVGGHHNPVWQNCDGRVYAAPIANENAVHSLEHGAVWITYSPALPAADRAVLAAKVTGKNYMLMSPYDGLAHPVYLQAWGYQLAVDDVHDPRVDRFIERFRVSAGTEPGAPCINGTSRTGLDPHGAD